ncbi:hypothetical protein [Xylanibacter rodentium]|jgi:hypothetical protein|uniref:DUF4352 domain-containing protein n=1 Tax=Xylanibacter rodentium TaxID=2736289 RepID=A0ABX2AUI8_9BACT|nr:hypothetical protein [Xylanibacter rodentium]NPE10822.1 hypothetical protein [Prevotella sp. PJ1A]NPE14384.1 hypothetical protein [Xylanibacter rodentium]NPE38006.1 hypothetical protein [Prevotella sp. PCJ2]
MKRLLLFVVSGLTALSGFSQEKIQFHINRSAQENITGKVADALDLKLKQVMNRNSAAAADVYNVFAIDPAIELTDVVSTEGLVQNVSVAQGNLTLIARNMVDGTMYYSATIPVKGDALGSKESAMLKMISNIKVTDAVYTRFIRIARQKIDEYYAANCGTVLQKAQRLFEEGRYEEAQLYLKAVSPSLPCYEEANMLRQEIVRNIPTNTSPDTVVVEQVVEKPVIVVIDRVVEKPVPVEQVVEKPVPVEEKTVDREPVAEKLDCEISISTQDYTFKVLKCFGDMTQKRITIQAAVTNVTDRNFDQERVEFRSAFTTDGVKLNSLDTDGLYQEYPSRVTRPRNFYITGVNSKIPGLSFVKLGIGGTTVEIRNLPVQW